jgi:hypothetical protein
MKAQQENDDKKLTSEKLVDLYFSRIIERQRLENEFYSTGNASLLPEIAKARQRINDVMNEMLDD